MKNDAEEINRTHLAEQVQGSAKEIVAFGALYHAADVQWIGGALVGNAIVDKYGLNPWVVSAGVASSVAFLEYKLSDIAVRAFEKKDDIEENPGKIKRTVQELGAASYAAFAGSANGVKINDSLGLESTPTRRKIQAAIFGTAVGLWVTPLPGYEQGADFAQDRIDEMINDPKTFALYSIISIGSILGISKAVKETRKAFSRYKSKKSDPSA